MQVTGDLLRDARSMLSFWEGPTPAVVPVQPRRRDDVAYICSNASGQAFGAGTQDASGEIVIQDGL